MHDNPKDISIEDIYGIDNKYFIPADAEYLAEGGIQEFIENLRPFFLTQGITLPAISQTLDEQKYNLRIGDKTYLIYNEKDIEADAEKPGWSWGKASVATFTIINDFLHSSRSELRAYAVNGGHDLFCIFLTPEVFSRINASRTALFVPNQVPYEIRDEYPSYGMRPPISQSSETQSSRRYLKPIIFIFIIILLVVLKHLMHPISTTASAPASVTNKKPVATVGKMPLTISLDANYVVHRPVTKPGEYQAITWVIKKNGSVVLKRNAENEFMLKPDASLSSDEYSVHLEAFSNGSYNPISNIINFTPNLQSNSLGTISRGQRPMPYTGDKKFSMIPITIDANHIVRRSAITAGSYQSLTWVVMVDGRVVLEADAENHSEHNTADYFGNECLIYLKAFMDGAYYPVSNEINCKH